MRIESEQVVAPAFPGEAEWINSEPLELKECVARGPLLVEFWDFARVNSLRTLAYMEEWQRRYAPLGASVVGIHSPGFSLSADGDAVRSAVTRLGVERPVVLDPDYRQWHDYGNKGWPARYLWGPKGHMRYWHYGEGDYLECELALQAALQEFGCDTELPAPMDPVRPEDAPEARFEPQTADLALPADRARVRFSGEWQEGADWMEAQSSGASLSVNCRAGTAWAVLSGPGLDYPGCHEVAIDGDGSATVTAAEPGLRVHGVQFTPIV